MITKRLFFSFFLLIIFLAAASISEPAQRLNPGDGRGARREGRGRPTNQESLGELEAKASAAKGSENWREAALFYIRAAAKTRHLGQYQQAVDHGKEAMAAAEKAGNPALQVRAILQMVFVHNLIGQRETSKELLERGIELVKQVPAERVRGNLEANLYRELGLYYLSRKDHQKAIESITYALQAQESQLALLSERGGRFSNPRLIRATRNSMIVTLQRLGNAYKNTGNSAEAIKTYEKGLSVISEFGRKTAIEGRLYQELGDLYLKEKDIPRALENLTKAVDIADATRNAYVLQRASSQIGDLLRQTRRGGEAIPYYQKAIDSIEMSRSLLESEEARSSFFESKRHTYAGMILAQWNERNREEAFNYNERARSRAFLDILGNKVELGRGSLLEEERTLQARIRVLGAKLAGAEQEDDENEADQDQNLKELEEARKAYNDFLAMVRKENSEQASLMNVEPLTLKRVQELMEPGVTILEYFVVRDSVLLWVVEKHRLRFARIPVGRKELVAKVGSLREAISQLGERRKIDVDSNELYKLLIEPALPYIGDKELLIIPHDVLHYLPFHALISSRGRYLIQDYPVYYLSSASLMQFTKEKRRASREGERALVMGNPDLGDQAYDLRFAEREAREIARVYPESAVYLRAQATKPKAVKLSPSYEILHFAVHGELNEDDPLESALLLASEGKGDGKLKVGEIFSLNLKADAVVLSACETALGKLSNGDELVGLTRAFIYAGTPSVIATLWKVNDQASYELMREFYNNLKTMKKSEALRQAQLKTMNDFPQPFFWAAYGLTGEP